MPAIELSRLREQITRLMGFTSQPGEFHRALTDLLDRHGEHAYRPGEAVTTRPILPSYRVPALVFRQLEQEISRACLREPEAMMAVADILWQDSYLEMKVLAAHILGSIPEIHSSLVLDRLTAWIVPSLDRNVLDELMSRGTATIRRGNADDWLSIIRSWLEQKNTPYRKLGLMSLEVTIPDAAFHNIPATFRLLAPLVHSPDAPLLNGVQFCIAALARRTEAETAYFLRQSMGSSPDALTARLIRRVLPEFSPEFQTSLKNALRSARIT